MRRIYSVRDIILNRYYIYKPGRFYGPDNTYLLKCIYKELDFNSCGYLTVKFKRLEKLDDLVADSFIFFSLNLKHLDYKFYKLNDKELNFKLLRINIENKLI